VPCECQCYGAIEVGVIFPLFADGELEADDEVAITYDPDTLRPTSEPLANLRIAFARAAAEEVVTPATAEAAVTVARRLYFSERSYWNVLRLLVPHVPPRELAALAGFVSGVRCPDQKRDDAVELLAAVASATAGHG
jgi:TfuA protein